MSRIQFIHSYDTIISLDNLLLAWSDFVVGKKSRKDVQEFERNLRTFIADSYYCRYVAQDKRFS